MCVCVTLELFIGEFVTVLKSWKMDDIDGKCFSRTSTEIKHCIAGEHDEQDSNVENNNHMAQSRDQAVVSTGRYADYYKMNHRRRGLALIFNHQHFKDPLIREREGTDEDVINLKTCLNDLRFEVQIFKDLTLAEIRKQTDLAADTKHSNADCILVAVLTHGAEEILHAYDQVYSPQKELYEKFMPQRCAGLAGKPKIFLIQACQGEKTDDGVELRGRTEFDGLMGYRIPCEADFLIIHATPPGSYFIKVFCQQLELLGLKDHLLDILTVVNNRVAVEFVSRSRDPAYNDKKQMPYIMNTLTKKIHFAYPNVHSTSDREFLFEN